MSNETKVEVAPPSPEEAAWIESQMKLANQQIDILAKQAAFSDDYMTLIKPVLEAQKEIILASANAANDPVQQAIVAKTAELQLAQLEHQGALMPMQLELMKAQLDQLKNGYKATPEQEALIDQTIQSQLAMGRSDLLDFSQQAMEQLRDELAPSLGLRPTDTPILDRGGEIQEQATRQYGQLERGLQAAGAEAKLNYPLAAAGVGNQAAQFQQNLQMAQQQLAGQLSSQAAQNRIALAGVSGQPVSSAIGQGLGLANIGPSPLPFQRGSTTTQSGFGTVMSGLGALGGFASGLGELGWQPFSDERLKVGVKFLRRDDVGRDWYSFRLLGDKTNVHRIGVMAQEVFFHNPKAVIIDDSGFLRVDYRELEAADAA